MLKLETRIKKYWNRVDKRGPKECWPWKASLNTKGYGSIRWFKKGVNAHRVAWYLANGEIPDGLHCLHKCDNRACQNPSHLFLGTNLDNIADKVSKGRHRGARGERSSTAKLTAERVYQILDRAAGGEKYSTIAKDFGVHEGHISMIVTRRTWKHLPYPRPDWAPGFND